MPTSRSSLIDTSPEDILRAFTLAAEMLVWWIQVGRILYSRSARISTDYGAGRDDGLRSLVKEAVCVLGGWRSARRLVMGRIVEPPRGSVKRGIYLRH